MAPAKLRAEWQRDGRLDNVTYSLRQEKVLGYLVENAQVTEVDQLTQPPADAAGRAGARRTSTAQKATCTARLRPRALSARALRDHVQELEA